MKMQGEWAKGEIQSGRWIYPNGVYYEGTFKNNKPDGQGTWHFSNGNQLNGSYKQTEKINEEEEEAEGEPKKMELQWQANTNISESAFKVNSVEH